jgi:hypothetical protein
VEIKVFTQLLFPKEKLASFNPGSFFSKGIVRLLSGLFILGLVLKGTAQTAELQPNFWWYPGQGDMLAAEIYYPNAIGQSSIINADGPVNTAGHPFFEPIGSNGRASVTCH